MLPAVARIRSGADYSAVMKHGRRAKRGGVVVHLAAHPSSTARHTRAGFIVSKAVGTAVVRNTVKRRLRHLAADRLQRWPHGTDVVVRALPEAAGRSFEELAGDVDAAVAAIVRRRR